MKNILIISFCLFSQLGFAQSGDIQETVALIRHKLEESRTRLKNYEWIETTTTYLKGEQKSKKQQQCYFGVDGKLYKIQTGNEASARKPRGIRGAIAENKKEEMQDYLEKATKIIASYFPPDPAKLSSIFNSGNASIQVLEPGKKFKLDFKDYLLKGDVVSFTVDKEKNMILNMFVHTYIDRPDEQVDFAITYSTLPDGTQYQSESNLEVSAKQVKIVIENSGFKKASSH